MTIKLILSNSYNILAEKLAENLLERDNNSDDVNPFQKQTIIVQTEGMQKWLSLKISKNNSVFGNFDFIGVNDYFKKIYYLLLDLDDSTISGSNLFQNRINGLYRKESLKWIIFDIFKDNLSSDNDLIDLKKYLFDVDINSKKGNTEEGKTDFQKMFQLSNRLADLYDQYLIHRWELIGNWSKDKLYFSDSKYSKNLSKLEKWQKKIWLYIKQILGDLEPDKIEIRNFIIKNLKSKLNNPLLRDKISDTIGTYTPLFGFSIIPEYYLEIFNLLSDIIEIPFYLMNPSNSFWYDIEKQDSIIKKELQFLREQNTDPELLHLYIGNPLLAEMGKTGKDFINLLFNIDGVDSYKNESYDKFEKSDLTILEIIKKDILELNDGKNNDNTKSFYKNSDQSIKVVSTSSNLREIEILRDYLLDIFSNNNKNKNIVAATDILVLAPDIEEYASFIELLFSSSKIQNSGKNQYIPFSISSKSFSSSNIAAAVFLNILHVSNGKALSSEIFSIIDSIPVRNKFSLKNEDLDTIKGWIDKVGIRWGLNKEHRGKVDNIQYEENSWKQGLDKLMAGYSLFEEKDNSFSDIIPFTPMNSENSELLGKFIEITEIIFDIIAQHSTFQKRSISKWAEYFEKFCDQLFSDGFDDESYSGVDKLKQMIAGLNRLFTISNENIEPNNLKKENNISKIEKIKESKIEFSIISKEIINQLSTNQNKDEKFMHRGITFSNLVPMRSIPFKVVCIIGMNQDKYPRVNKNSDIDLISLDPKIGDRTVRDNDLYLFLDTLLSAQENLYISYIGKSIVDNSERLPSQPVSSLLDYIENNFKMEDSNESVKSKVFTEHPLQPFSIKYQLKKETDLYTYNNIYSVKSNSKINKGNIDTRTSLEQLPKLNFNNRKNDPKDKEDDNNIFTNLNSKDLIKFFKNPSEYYYTNQKLLSSRFSEIQEPLNDRDNFKKNNLIEYHIAKTLIEAKLRGENLSWLKDKIKSEGNLPYGKNSKIYLDTLEAKCLRLANKLDKEGYYYPNIKTSFEIELDNIKINVNLDNYFENSKKIIFWHTTKLKAKHKLEALITHLLANIYSEEIKTIFISETETGKDNYFSLKTIIKEEAEKYLIPLLKLYTNGMISPLVFFPKSSLIYTKEMCNEKNDSDKVFNKKVMNELYYNTFNYTPEIASSEYFKHFFPDSENFKINHRNEFQQNSSIIFDIFFELLEQEL